MKKEISAPVAHAMALVTALIWGITFIASKVLLREYTPTQIIIMRFVLAYFILLIVKPKFIRLPSKEELGCAFLGLVGCTLYFLAENYALEYTLAANVSILVAASPILTTLLTCVINKERLRKNILMGFAFSMAGAALVVFNGTVVLKLSPAGDALSFGAAVMWAVYTVSLRKYVAKYDGVLITRRILFWGAVTSIPFEIFGGGGFSLAPLAQADMLVSVLFLGVLASAAGYVMWNVAVKKLGGVKATNYIYFIPFFTMVAAYFLLNEPISFMGIAGTVFIIAGVIITEKT